VRAAAGLTLKIQALIAEAEKQLGIGPLNRLMLGLVVSESFKTLADLNAEAEDECDTYDIRLAAVPDDAGKKENPATSRETAATSADAPRSTDLTADFGPFSRSADTIRRKSVLRWVEVTAAEKSQIPRTCPAGSVAGVVAWAVGAAVRGGCRHGHRGDRGGWLTASVALRQ
jgi:hypothetical protein